MILAAERLFGERGIEAVSLREIGALAGQRNNSAVQYHFGNKQVLVGAVFEFRMSRIDRRRRAMLETFEAEGRGGDLRALLEALIEPLAESVGHADGVSWYARFLAQVVFAPGFDAFSPALAAVTGGLATVVDRLRDHLRDVPGGVADQRLSLAVQLVVHSLADHERWLASGMAAAPTSLLVADLVDVTCAILTAPVSDRARREAERARPARGG